MPTWAREFYAPIAAQPEWMLSNNQRTANVPTMGWAACACSTANGVAGPRRECGDGHVVEKLKLKLKATRESESKEGWQLACACSAHSGKLEVIECWGELWTRMGHSLYCNEHTEFELMRSRDRKKSTFHKKSARKVLGQSTHKQCGHRTRA